MKTYLSSAIFMLLFVCARGVNSTAIEVGTMHTLCSGAELIVQDQLVTYSYETLPNGTVRFSLTNNEAQTITGDLIRERTTYPQNGEILTTFSVPSSGIFTYIDDTVLPGDSYVYIFEYTMEGLGEYIINFDTITPVSTIPALGHFNLIATSYDDAYDVLSDGYEIQIENTNIMVEANSLTRSVTFFLNGKAFKDNTAPFALYPETSGDYKKGHLRDGAYTLTAIAFPQKNGKGTAGDTLSVSFTVKNTYEDVKITVHPNPSEGAPKVKVTNGPANGNGSLKIVEHFNGREVFRTTIDLDANGEWSTSLPGENLRSGAYVLEYSIAGKVRMMRFIMR